MRELTPYKHNISTRYGSLTTYLKVIPIVHHILQDDNKAYMHFTTLICILVNSFFLETT
jgi:hypothetical protein